MYAKKIGRRSVNPSNSRIILRGIIFMHYNKIEWEFRREAMYLSAVFRKAQPQPKSTTNFVGYLHYQLCYIHGHFSMVLNFNTIEKDTIIHLWYIGYEVLECINMYKFLNFAFIPKPGSLLWVPRLQSTDWFRYHLLAAW